MSFATTLWISLAFLIVAAIITLIIIVGWQATLAIVVTFLSLGLLITPPHDKEIRRE